MKNLYVIIFFTFCFQLAIAQTIRINEVVSSNSEYFDSFGETPDWIELYNYGSESVNLLDWGITDDIEEIYKWKFPEITVNPNEYLLLWCSGKDIRNVSTFRTLVNQGDIFKYTVPYEQPDPSWNTLAFDDEDWLSGASGFGYDDGDDATFIPQGTTSALVRRKFNINDVDKLNELFLDIDFDDGFVAYINGIEISRYNVNGVPPSFNGGTNTDHEAKMYNGGLPDRFPVNDFKNIITNGENVLAIEIHNVSEWSSDLTLIPFLSASYNTGTSEGVNPPEILNLTNSSIFHTNFKISASGETIRLTDNQNNIIDELELSEMKSNISTGVFNDEIKFFIDPTPLYQNNSTAYDGILLNSNITFNHDGGPVSQSFNLELSNPTNDAIIRYTTDKTEPNSNSAIYNSPIPISETSVVRAALFKPGFISSFSTSKSYIFNTNHQIDIISMVTDPYNFFDNDYGIYVLGDDYQNGDPYFGANFWEDWERPVHVSFFDHDKNQQVSFNAGTKIFGGWSRGQNEQRSFSFFARSQYGDSEFKYPLFDELPYNSYQNFILRNSGQDWMRSSIHDAALTSLMRGSGLEFLEHNPAATYINGEYWGVYNMREKLNEHTIAAKFNLDPDDITILEAEGIIVQGDNSEYLQLIDYVSNSDLRSNINFQYVVDRVDLKNYALYQATQIYFNNWDWPGNNIKFWTHPEGKWRWFLYDTDFGFGAPWEVGWFNDGTTDDYQDNTLNHALEPNGPGWPNPPWSTQLFRALITNMNFRNQFINRYADELNSRFLYENVATHLETIYQKIAPELEAQTARWKDYAWDECGPCESSNARMYVDAMKYYAQNRPYHAKEHLKARFNLPNNHEVTLINDTPERGHIILNDNLNVEQLEWKGDYFETVPITLKAQEKLGYEFSHWTYKNSTWSDQEILIALDNAETIEAHFINSSISEAIVINEINYNSPDDFDPDDWIELYNPNSESLDLSNWMIKDDDDTHVYTIPQNTSIVAEGYLIIVRDALKFEALFPNISFIGELGYGLGGGGDQVRLFDANENLVDFVEYDDKTPWPECADGNGYSLELNAWNSDNELAESWACVNEYGSPGRENIFVLSKDSNEDYKISLRNNPVNDIIEILTPDNNTNLNHTIYDLTGKYVLEAFNTNKINVSKLSSGIYILVVKNELLNTKSIHKFIKE